tara:strand:+ start:2862 stop:3497 length:636 start_codon:yes stop_codon:yes gene_type:complete
MYRLLIAGAGGVTSYLLPVLLKTFKISNITLVDKDVLEERNLDRQQFNVDAIGNPKAEALSKMFWDYTKFDVKIEWLTTNTDCRGYDLLICACDNHKARRDILTISDMERIPAIIGGNEYIDSEAYMYLPKWRDTEKDPRIYYPDILLDNYGSPLNCTGELQEVFPQLAMANMSCASHILHLMWNLFKSKADIELRPYRRSTKEYKNESFI